MARNTLSRSLHDLGLAAWFGGTLANAVALNPAAAQSDTDTAPGSCGKHRMGPLEPGKRRAIAAHRAGSLGQLRGNSGRILGQKGVGSMVLVKTGLTVAALGATAYSRALGRRVSDSCLDRRRGRPPSGQARLGPRLRPLAR